MNIFKLQELSKNPQGQSHRKSETVILVPWSIGSNC